MSPTAVVVDDSSTIRTVIKVGLTKAGFTVVATGGTGKEAIDLFAQHQPTVMFLDIVLPELDGVSAATEIIKKFPSANIVMCSSLSSREKVLACREAGVSHFILKPFTTEKIVQTAQSILTRLAEGAPPVESKAAVSP